MKRIVALLVALLLVVACAATVYAEDTPTENPDVVATLESVAADRGEEVTLTVTLAGAADTNAAGIQFAALPDGITLKSAVWELSGMIADFNTEYNEGVFAAASAIAVNGEVFTVTFEVAEDIPFGEYEIDFEFYVDTTANKSLNVSEVAGVITIACENHVPAEDYESDEDGHWIACEECGAELDGGEHEFEYECSTICDVCEYERDADHKYSEEYEYNGEYHWVVCEYCGDEDEAEHVLEEVVAEEYLWQTANCVSPAIYGKSCECGYVDFDERFESGEVDADAHYFTYDHETGSAICAYGCGEVIEDVKGEDVTEIEGGISAPEGILGSNFEAETEDFTDMLDEDIDFGEFDEDFEGFETVQYTETWLTVSGYEASFVEGMKFTATLPEMEGFNDVVLVWAFYAPNTDNIVEYTDNGDGTFTIEITEEMAQHNALPLLFIGKPVEDDPTGDNGHIALWIAVLAFAALSVVATVVYSKKKATK